MHTDLGWAMSTTTCPHLVDTATCPTPCRRASEATPGEAMRVLVRRWRACAQSIMPISSDTAQQCASPPVDKRPKTAKSGGSAMGGLGPIVGFLAKRQSPRGKWRALCLVRWLDRPKPVVQTIAAVERRRVSAAEVAYLDEMRSAPFAAYRWSRATGSTRTGHPAAGAAHYGVIAAEHVLYRGRGGVCAHFWEGLRSIHVFMCILHVFTQYLLDTCIYDVLHVYSPGHSVFLGGNVLHAYLYCI